MFPRRQVSSEQKFQRTAVVDCSCFHSCCWLFHTVYSPPCCFTRKTEPHEKNNFFSYKHGLSSMTLPHIWCRVLWGAAWAGRTVRGFPSNACMMKLLTTRPEEHMNVHGLTLSLLKADLHVRRKHKHKRVNRDDARTSISTRKRSVFRFLVLMLASYV